MRWSSCAAAGFATVALSGCVSAPRLSAHTPFSVNETPSRFGERVKQRFPIGSAEDVLVAELSREHFKIRPQALPREANPKGYTSTAVYNGGYYLACEADWGVWWRAEAGRITVIDGSYSFICL